MFVNQTQVKADLNVPFAVMHHIFQILHSHIGNLNDFVNMYSLLLYNIKDGVSIMGQIDIPKGHCSIQFL